MSATIHPITGRAEAPSIAPLLQLVAGGMNNVNEIILARMQSDVAVIPALAGHLISGGGKRLRPMLTLASAQLLDYGGTRHHKLAAAVEFIHTATLLHDDVVDGSEQRRGKKAANLIYGNQATVVVGDFLFSRAFELMVEDGSLRVLKILSSASAIIAQGEVDQLQTQRRIDTTETRYLEVITAKPAVLFAAACQIAGVVAERGEGVEGALESYGRNLGIAFQLVDDAIDYAGDDAAMGKDTGDDFKEGKLTLPVILAYRRGDADAKRFWKRTIGEGDAGEGDLAEATRRMRETGAIDYTLERARHYGRLAVDAIADFPGGAAKDALTETVAFAVARAY